MGLKLQYCCNLLNTLLRHNNEEFYVELNSQAIQKELHCRFQTKGIYLDFNKLRNSMDRFVERLKKESIKNTMLKHEEIFEQQVQELHRLYEVQKKLMSDLRGKKLKINNPFEETSNPEVITDQKNRFRSSASTSETSHSSQAIARNHSTAVLNSEHTSLHQFSTKVAGHSFCEPLRTSKKYNFQHPVEGESHESYSSEGCNLDLTLSIGCATDKEETDWKQMTNDSSQFLSSNLNRPESMQECTNSSAGFGADSLKRPHWLFQAMSLNRT